MLQSHRVLVNTIALYFRIIINSIVVLFSTRIALEELGVDSFGLYNLVAGVITLLSFFSGALTVSTQRFLSFAIGENDIKKLNKVFNLSLAVHFGLSFIVIILFKLLQPFLFDGFLNIQEKDIENAVTVYNVMIFSCAVTIFTIPFNAVINAREEMWFSSISDIISILLKLFAAIMLFYIINDKLIVYSYLMVFAIIIGSLINILWCKFRYNECKLNFKLQEGDILLFKEMFSFAGWNTLGSLAVVCRNQGVAVVLNIFFGTFVNAAYGVANQLNSLVITFASTLTTVFTPMIVKSKGANDHDKMIFVSVFSSKVSFLLSSFIAIPVLLHTEFILNHWLKVIPGGTINFCKAIIITFLIMQLYPGITRAIYAAGKIKWYQISISILLILNVPIGYLLFSLGFAPVAILYTMILVQFLTLLTTIYFAKKIINLNVKEFLINSVLKAFILFLGVYSLGEILQKTLQINKYLNFITTSVFLAIIYISIFYIFIFNDKEKALLVNLFTSLKNIINEKISKKNSR
ncbi:MATE family efflux transporter [Flavobacterium sp. I3-2]|uniref:MATE family efflux transporter n=1 Tax=Flavobacterium sp. I3-2 TaxID=2748319 RepID=UPI0015A97B9F|nr:MATE family efflux transporter [Flavobacterium sp. I3-2]